MRSKPDGGLGDAYNRAFPCCRGQIVGTLDPDNLLLPNALDAVDALFREHRTAVAIHGAVKMIDTAGHEVGLFVPEAFDQGAVMGCELVPPFSTSFFHRQRCGRELRGDASLATNQDFELWLRLSDRGILRSTSHPWRNPVELQEHVAERRELRTLLRGKIDALERFIADRPHLKPERNAAVTVYCWAAESILKIDGLRVVRRSRGRSRS
jgi:glycosyltransferase involved in cell wall biosynthesis